jgi:pseudouridine kinase
VAENLARLGVDVALVARVGDDDAGAALRSALSALGVDVTGVCVTRGSPTARYVAVLDPWGELVIGVADMAVLEQVTVPEVDAAWPSAGLTDLATAWVVLDCNLAPQVLSAALERGRRTGIPVAVDAVSTAKVVRLPQRLDGVAVLFANRDEARGYLSGAQGSASDDDATLARRLQACGAAAVVLTRGRLPVLVAEGGGCREVAVPSAEVVDVTGAGDALVAATVAGLALARQGSLVDAVADGVAAAALTVGSPVSVRADLTPALIANRRSLM